MNGIAVLLGGIAILVIAYLTYGKWLAKQWGIDPSRETPSHTEEDGIDYVPAKASVLMGHHFSSIAGSGPINGPIQAAVFGWVPVLLWVLIGGIFFGAVHDFGALFTSIRHKGQSIGEVIATTMGTKAKKMFIIFCYLTLILVVAAFASVVANTFTAKYSVNGTVSGEDGTYTLAAFDGETSVGTAVVEIKDGEASYAVVAGTVPGEKDLTVAEAETTKNAIGKTVVVTKEDSALTITPANTKAELNETASTANATTAVISLLFIVIAIAFGFLVYRRNAGLGVSTVVGVAAIVVCMVIGIKWHPLYLNSTVWMVIIGIYILIASVTPVWILLQPRDYLSSFLLYFMMAAAIVGIVGCGLTGGAHMDIPAFTGFKDTLAPTGTSLGYMFPALFVTIACGAISGFHSLVGSGTTAKQLNNEKDAQPIAYGGMLIECALAIISLCAVGYIWESYASGKTVVPTAVFATGISKMLAAIPGLAATENVAYTLLVLTVSVFCLTSLDTATRLARYMFQEFWLEPGQTCEQATGYKKILSNPYVATLMTVIPGVALGLTGYANIWPLFGAANQLLAALGLLAVATWLGQVGKNNKMFMFPMAFMLVVTITSLVLTIKANIKAIPVTATGVVWCYVRIVLAALLVVLAIILAIDGVKTLASQKKEKAA